jgi:hypothetical protein
LGLVCGEELEETASTVNSAKQSTLAAEVLNTIRNPTIKNKIVLFFVCVRKSLIGVWSPQTLTYYMLSITN